MRFAVCCDRRKLGEDFYFSLKGLTTENTERELFTIQQRTSAARLEGKYEPRMAWIGTDKKGLGCSRQANGAEKQQTSCKRACASFDFSPPIPLRGIIHATEAIYE